MVGGLLGLLTVMPAVRPAEQARAADTIPVVDAFVIDIPVDDGSAVARFEGAIHGAFRVPEGTVVYWSLRETPGSDVGIATALDYEDVDLVGGVLADPASLDVLLPVEGEDGCLCTVAEDIPSSVDGSRFQTMYTTFPPMSRETRTVDIDVDGRGTIVAGVPVSDSLPPGNQVDAATTPLGTGWPAAPGPEVLGGDDPEAQDLVGRSTSQGGQVTTEGTGADRLVRFDADVLFDFDRSDLTPPAREVLDAAVVALQEAGATQVEVVGHTDGRGTALHNQELSVLRAQTVADVLTTALGPEVTIAVEGRGWDEPIATNDTDEGRAKNRRVTISYTSGED